MRHWITSFLLLTMRLNLREAAGIARVCARKSLTGRAASRRLARVLACMAVGFALIDATCARAQTAVDLQLVLAVDVSGSVNQRRFELQRDGYVAAFRNARVLETIRSGPNQAIAVTMV